MTTTEELIEYIGLAENKDDIEKLLKDELKIDIDKRGSLETIKNKAIDLIKNGHQPKEPESMNKTLGEKENFETSNKVPVSYQESNSEQEHAVELTELINQVSPALETSEQRVAIIEAPQTIIPPELSTHPPGIRKLKSKKSGVEFIWTDELARLKDMVEV